MMNHEKIILPQPGKVLNSPFRGLGGLDDLILMIFKTHRGEWLCAQRVRAIVNAIKGTNMLLRPVKTSLQRLARNDKLTRMCTGDDGEATYTLTDAAQGFYL